MSVGLVESSECWPKVGAPSHKSTLSSGIAEDCPGWRAGRGLCGQDDKDVKSEGNVRWLFLEKFSKAVFGPLAAIGLISWLLACCSGRG